MIVGLGVVADDLHLFLDEPLARRRHEAGRAAEIVLVVLVGLVPAGVDDDDVARAHRRAGDLFEIVVGDRLPLFLRNRDHIPEPKKCGNGTSSMNGVPCTTCAGASMCVVLCMLVVMRCDSTPDFAM